MARLSTREAREIIDRAIERATSLDHAGAVAVVDPAGNLISMSLMDGGSSQSVPAAIGKATLAAGGHSDTDTFARRMDRYPTRYMAYMQILTRPTFPGPGGLPIKRDGSVAGGFATSGVLPHVADEGERKMPPGEIPKNVEDIVTAYALNIPYKEQHAGQHAKTGDDHVA